MVAATSPYPDGCSAKFCPTAAPTAAPTAVPTACPPTFVQPHLPTPLPNAWGWASDGAAASIGHHLRRVHPARAARPHLRCCSSAIGNATPPLHIHPFVTHISLCLIMIAAVLVAIFTTIATFIVAILTVTASPPYSSSS